MDAQPTPYTEHAPSLHVHVLSDPSAPGRDRGTMTCIGRLPAGASYEHPMIGPGAPVVLAPHVHHHTMPRHVGAMDYWAEPSAQKSLRAKNAMSVHSRLAEL